MTARFVYLHESSGKTAKKIISLGDYPIQEFVTVTFGAQQATKVPDERSALEEWDRYAFSPPDEDDPQWRFHQIEGVCTDAILSRIENDKTVSREIKLWAKRLKATVEKVRPSDPVKFEIARLMLSLPAYVAFMYDLVTEERRQLRQPDRSGKHFPKLRRLRKDPTYRIIRSIRVIRPPAETSAASWRSPARLHAVRGHWRMLPHDNSIGRSKDGERVVGKTWVRDHTRGEFREFDTEAELKRSDVVINIKQTLRYARDVIQAAGSTSEVSTRPVEKAPNGSPSKEWIAEERAKLSAGLRWLILKRDGFRCQICGASATESNFVRLEVDHKIPVTAWGRTEESNLWTLCRPCNGGKSNKQ